MLPELVEGAITGGGGKIPIAQPADATVDFGMIEFNPASGNQQEEFIVLTNNGEQSVDVSGWSLDGDVEKTFDPGTVIVPGVSLYVTPDAKAFRARAEGPSGGQKLWVQGNYDGLLPNVGGSLQLINRDGQVVNGSELHRFG